MIRKHKKTVSSCDSYVLTAARAIKLHSARECDDLSDMHCSTIGVRMQHGFAAQRACCTILAAGLSAPQTLTTGLRDTRCELEGPIWPYTCPLCETCLGPGP